VEAAFRQARAVTADHLEEEREMLPPFRDGIEADKRNELGMRWLEFHEQHDRAKGLSGQTKPRGLRRRARLHKGDQRGHHFPEGNQASTSLSKALPAARLVQPVQSHAERSGRRRARQDRTALCRSFPCRADA